MGYPTKIQLIKRKASQQWYVNFPAALAQAMEFNQGETVQWSIEDRNILILHRTAAVPSRLKKKPPTHSSLASNSSGKNAASLSPNNAPGSARKPLP